MRGVIKGTIKRQTGVILLLETIQGLREDISIVPEEKGIVLLEIRVLGPSGRFRQRNVYCVAIGE